MNISWEDKITNKEVLDRAGQPSMEIILIQMNLRWLGHVERMELASPQAATLLTFMRGQIQSEYTKAEIQRHCKKKPEEVGYRKEFVATDGQRRTELRRGILNETVIVASDRLL